MEIKMRVSLSQKEKMQELFEAIELLFNNEQYGLMYSEIKEAWLIGEALRDVLLFKNPQFHRYDFYIQAENKESIYPWLSRLAEYDMDFEVISSDFSFNEDEVFQIIRLNAIKLGILYEVNIIVGSASPEEFLVNNYPIALSQIGLDIALLFVLLSREESIEKIITNFWQSDNFKKDFKTKHITVLKSKWIKQVKHYTLLEESLEQLYTKLTPLGYN